MSYSVNLWCSHPNAGNDDCSTGVDFDTREEAEQVFHAKNPIAMLAAASQNPARFASSYHNIPFIELDGPDVYLVRQINTMPKRQRDEDREWRREIAMQAGMGLGVEAYNEAMGWD